VITSEEHVFVNHPIHGFQRRFILLTMLAINMLMGDEKKIEKKSEIKKDDQGDVTEEKTEIKVEDD
jgi:hypothetical protein